MVPSGLFLRYALQEMGQEALEDNLDLLTDSRLNMVSVV